MLKEIKLTQSAQKKQADRIPLRTNCPCWNCGTSGNDLMFAATTD